LLRLWFFGDSQAGHFQISSASLCTTIGAKPGATMVMFKRATWGAGCAALGSLVLGGCAESLYLTTPIPLNDDRYELIAPYCPEVKTKITVSIVQGTPVKDPTDTTKTRRRWS
jgi:hypothetical protein